MRKLTYDEYKLCQKQAELFEKSINTANFSSPMFIRRYMTSDSAMLFFNKTFFIASLTINDLIDDLNIKYKESSKAPMYTNNEMYWIGYIYCAISFLYNLRPKAIYKILNSKEIVKYYYIGHTYAIEDAAERIMQDIGYKEESYQEKAVRILRELTSLENKYDFKNNPSVINDTDFKYEYKKIKQKYKF